MGRTTRVYHTLAAAAAGFLLLFSIPGPALAGPWPGGGGGSDDTGARPGWERVEGGTRLHGRDVLADPDGPLPGVGESFYLFVDAALANDDLAFLAARGLRYLGVQDRRTYVFLVAASDPLGQRDALQGMPQVLGTAPVLAADRLLPPLSSVLVYGGNHDVEISFWPATTVAELAGLMGSAELGGMGVPELGTAEIGAARRGSWPGMSAASLEGLADSPLVASIQKKGTVTGLNAGSRQLSGADVVAAAPYGLDGAGVRVGVYDIGTLHSHSDFDMSRVLLEWGSPHEHGTAVTGTLFGSGQGNGAACGYASAAELISVSIANNGSGALQQQRRSNRRHLYHAVDNHSWSADTAVSNGYNMEAEIFDTDARDYMLLAVKAAGNFGAIVEDNILVEVPRSLHADSTLKNNVVVGGITQGASTWPLSSWGPTNDGRIKPDVMAKSASVFTTAPSNGYVYVSGTSFAAPAVTGMVVLLEQLYRREHGMPMAPDLVRALLIHTARDMELSGPDYHTGWGIADVHAAADLILADAAAPGRHLARGAVREGETWTASTLDVAAGSGPLVVTLAWLDAMGNSTSLGRLVHDLDLELVAPNSMRYGPWRLNPSQPTAAAVQSSGFGNVVPNERDNVEQIVVAAPTAGVWQVRVTGTEVGDPAVPVQGFVVASSHGLDHVYTRAVADIGLTVSSLDHSVEGVVIPDNDPTGVEIPLHLSGVGTVAAARLFLDVEHDRRGDLEIDLIAPGGTPTVRLQEDDGFTNGPFFALFPDLHTPEGNFGSFTGLTAAGTWTLRLRDRADGSTGSVLMAALELDGVVPNAPPVAVAVAVPPTVVSGTEVTLDATGSSDAEGHALSFSWTQQAGPAVTLTSPSAAVSGFTAPEVTTTTVLGFMVTVADAFGGAGSALVEVTVEPNMPPVAVAIVSGGMMGNESIITLDASDSYDPEGGALSYRWEPLDIELAIYDHTTPHAFFYGPLPIAAPYRVELQVTDPQGLSDTVEIVFGGAGCCGH